MCIPRATVSAVSCPVVPAFICIDLLVSRVLKINDDDDDDDDGAGVIRSTRSGPVEHSASHPTTSKLSGESNGISSCWS